MDSAVLLLIIIDSLLFTLDRLSLKNKQYQYYFSVFANWR